jgi:hypothetical protein
VAHPLACSNVSHASQMGNGDHFAKYPNPQIADIGARSLNKNGENSGAVKVRREDGRQKFTSVRSGRPCNYSYQPLSVTATVPIK